jgi:hypothetical protein
VNSPVTRSAPLGPAAGAPAGGTRPSVIQLVFREKGALYAAYMPVLTDGGLFVPTTRDYRLGEDIYLLLSLPDDPFSAIRWPARWPGSRRPMPRAAAPRVSACVPERREDTRPQGEDREHPRHRDLVVPSRRRRSDRAARQRALHVRRFPLPSELSGTGPHRRGARAMHEARVERALCICTTLEEFPVVHGWHGARQVLWATAGVHPDNEGVHEPSVDLVAMASLPRVVAIGETGLDYYRLNGRSVADMAWQRERFRATSAPRVATGLPLVVHTRSASADTLAVLPEGRGAERAASSTASPRA